VRKKFSLSGRKKSPLRGTGKGGEGGPVICEGFGKKTSGILKEGTKTTNNGLLDPSGEGRGWGGKKVRSLDAKKSRPVQRGREKGREARVLA